MPYGHRKKTCYRSCYILFSIWAEKEVCIRTVGPVRCESPLSMSNLVGGFHHVFPLVTSPTCLVLSCCSYIKVPNIDRLSLLLRFCFFTVVIIIIIIIVLSNSKSIYKWQTMIFFVKKRARFKSLHTIQLSFQSLRKSNVDIL